MTDSRFPFSPEDWIKGTRKLSLEQRGAYIDIIAQHMINDGPVESDPGYLSYFLGVSRRKVAALLAGLGVKLKVTEHGIINERCVREIAERHRRKELRSAAARQRWKDEDAVDIDYEQVVPVISPPKTDRDRVENETNSPRTRLENSKNSNKNNAGSEHVHRSRVGARADSNITSLREVDTVVEIESPLCPPHSANASRGGVSAQDHDPSESRSEGGDKPRKPRKPRAEPTMASEAQASAALDLYNRAADHWGFHRCKVLQGNRRRRLRVRLAEIGGVENFRLALRQIGKNDFLMGRAKGHEDFVLDLDRLLQDRGLMGDVLAGLIDAAHAGPAEPKTTVKGKGWGWWRGKEANLRALTDEQWQQVIGASDFTNGWPWWGLGAWPGHDECLVPAHLIERNNLGRFANGGA